MKKILCKGYYKGNIETIIKVVNGCQIIQKVNTKLFKEYKGITLYKFEVTNQSIVKYN